MTNKMKSIVALTSLVTSGISDNTLENCLKEAKGTGFSYIEIVEILSELEFHSSWQNVDSVFCLAKKIWNDSVQDTN